MRRGSEHGKVACFRGGLGSGQRLFNDSWRLRFRRGIRRGAKIPRDAASDCRAHQQQSGPGVFGATRVRDAEIVLSSFLNQDGFTAAVAGLRSRRAAKIPSRNSAVVPSGPIIKTLPMLVACAMTPPIVGPRKLPRSPAAL